jgi:hypothetical protein
MSIAGGSQQMHERVSIKIGIPYEIHLRDQPRRAAANREMHMCGPPSTNVGARKVRTRSDGPEGIPPVIVRDGPSDSQEVRVQRLVGGIILVRVSSPGIGSPNLNQDP